MSLANLKYMSLNGITMDINNTSHLHSTLPIYIDSNLDHTLYTRILYSFHKSMVLEKNLNLSSTPKYNLHRIHHVFFPMSVNSLVLLLRLPNNQ